MQPSTGPGITTVILIICACSLLSPALAPAADGDAVNGHKLFQAYCSVCHGPEGKGDGVAADVLQKKPPDLTDDTFMTGRSDVQVFDAIRGNRRFAHRPLAMPDWQEALRTQQIWDVVAYVRTLHREPPYQGIPARGAALYTTYCWTCHGATGNGNGILSPLFETQPQNLTAPQVLSKRTDAELYNVIRQGGAAAGRSAGMPAWGGLLTQQEIWDLVSYLRRLAARP
jgi:cbb3-type cytochrome c oxidase subunit III